MDRVAYFAEMAGGSRSPWAHYGVYMLVGHAARRLRLGAREPAGEARDPQGAAHLGAGPLGLRPRSAGVIMGYGARLARGCTSGQALSGGAVLSVGSWAFAFSIFAGGYAVAWFFRRLWT